MICEFKDSEDWRYASGLACIAKSLEVLSRNQTIETINGNKDFQGQNVKILKIWHQKVYFMPKEIGKFLPNLEGLAVFNSKLKSIDRSDLAQFPALKYLRLSDNDLEWLDNDLFLSNLELQKIDFDRNKLKFIGEYLLEPLKNLEIAYFGSNICIDKQTGHMNRTQTLIADIKNNCTLNKVVRNFRSYFTGELEVIRKELEMKFEKESSKLESELQ